ncbi:hypothetical protein ACXWTF_12800 [Thiomicrolovo sp. ZZH C-3]
MFTTKKITLAIILVGFWMGGQVLSGSVDTANQIADRNAQYQVLLDELHQ